MYERILVPIDGSSCSDQAVMQSVELAAGRGSTITFLFVMDTIPVEMIPKAARAALIAATIHLTRVASFGLSVMDPG